MSNIVSIIWAWILAHPTTMSLSSYFVVSAFVSSLAMPDTTSGGFYRFFFKFVNALAANFSRASASSTVSGYQAPKPETVPGPEVPAPGPQVPVPPKQ